MVLYSPNFPDLLKPYPREDVAIAVCNRAILHVPTRLVRRHVRYERSGSGSRQRSPLAYIRMYYRRLQT